MSDGQILLGDCLDSLRKLPDGCVQMCVTSPPEIPELCIKAGSKIGDTILDPFGGSGTTAAVAEQWGRKWIICELNPAYCELARQFIGKATLPLLEPQ
jgi:DNA modification methylase